MTVCIYR